MSNKVKEILRKSIGLNVESVSRNKVDADIQLRMRACGIAEPEVYANLLEHSPDELKKLIETVTVPETWFFRLPGSFAQLENILIRRFNRDRKCQPVRILSIPCSSGEEPYSIAMTCYECGYSSDEFKIDATDISEICLEKAREAFYTMNSFRGVRQRIIDRYFTRSDKFYHLDRKIVDSVNFYQGNVLEFTPAAQPYDIIFCRNMLIYFEKESLKKVIAYLKTSLSDEGILFAGHSEAGVFFDSPFVPFETDGSFSYIKCTSKEPPKPVIPATQPIVDQVPDIFTARPRKSATDVSPKRRRRQTAATEMLKSATTVKPAENIEDSEAIHSRELARAEELAGNGDLEQAENICRKCIDLNKLDHQAYCLMGMIKLSGNSYTEAESYFNKALYLNPDYYEALLSIAILHERSGNIEAARTFRNRAGKIKL